MAKIKVSEATGRVLDWMVAIAKGINPSDIRIDRDRLYRWMRDGDGQLTGGYMTGPELLFSRMWESGGPIISKLGESNGFQLTTHVTHSGAACGWRASCDYPNGFYFGETALIAAMRCYAASELGEEVEVPDELLKGQ